MTTKLLLVDFENVQQVDLSKLDDTYRVIIFVGASQKNIPIDLVTNAQKLGGRIEPSRVGRFCPRVTKLTRFHRLGN